MQTKKDKIESKKLILVALLSAIKDEKCISISTNTIEFVGGCKFIPTIHPMMPINIDVVKPYKINLVHPQLDTVIMEITIPSISDCDRFDCYNGNNQIVVQISDDLRIEIPNN